MLRAYAGIRPTLFGWHKNEDDLSRDHKVIDHSNQGAPGLMSITGGKLAAYRMMSEDAVDRICEKLDRRIPCRTHELPLPGGDNVPEARELAGRYKIPPHAASRIIYRHGSRAQKILDLLSDNPAWRRPVCRCEPVLEAELRYVIRNEWVSDLNDLRRRTRMGMGPCQGARCGLRAALILADEKKEGSEAALVFLERFLQRRFKGKAPVLKGSMMAQEEISQATYQCLGRLGDYVAVTGC
jgi:glycerol-3-phosphate dehydrogenase